MVVRTWRGWTNSEDAEAYTAYLEETGLKEYRGTPGNEGVLLLRRMVGEEAEFLLVSTWSSMEAVQRFAGDDPERAVFYPEDEKYLTRYDVHVDHYEQIPFGEPPGNDEPSTAA